MKNPIFRSFRTTFCLAVLMVFSGPHPTVRAEIEPAARALAESVAAKLTTAQTLHLTAKHELDPELRIGTKLEKGPLQITVKRPNQFYIEQAAGDETRVIAYDGQEVCVMHPELKHHAIEPLKAASIEAVADALDARFGFRPPLMELLANDLVSQLFVGVTSASVMGREWVGWTRCDRLHFVQEGMTGDLWVGAKDKLPRRLKFTFTDQQGNPVWDIRLSKWELDAAVDAALFTKRPAEDSTSVQMLKSR